MSVKVNFFCHFNHTGVGRHCENAFFAMNRQRPAGLLLDYVNNTRETSVRRAIAQGRVPLDVTLFFWCYPAALVQQFAGRRATWWFFESDRLAPRWLQEIDVFDEIWVPSHWGREVLLAHGVPDERVRTLESGVNSQVFRPAPLAHEAFVFLSVGKYENRKSIDETVAAFAAEFPAPRYPSVQLWLKADFPLFPERVRQLAQKFEHDRRIRVISGALTDRQMAELYNAADAFVFASKAEGFGLPCLEAIACGVPVIATRYSAQSVFLDRIPGLYVPVEYRIAPIVDGDYSYFYANDYDGQDFGNWALPSIQSLRNAMREVYEQPALWRERALQASAILREEFDWDVIGRKALQAAQALHGRASVG